jgi:hypothetical protein
VASGYNNEQNRSRRKKTVKICLVVLLKAMPKLWKQQVKTGRRRELQEGLRDRTSLQILDWMWRKWDKGLSDHFWH